MDRLQVTTPQSQKNHGQKTGASAARDPELSMPKISDTKKNGENIGDSAARKSDQAMPKTLDGHYIGNEKEHQLSGSQ